MKYTASLDKLAKGLTILVIIILTAIIIATVNVESLKRIPSLVGLGLPVLAMFLTYLYAPKSYTLNQDTLVINKVAGKVNIDLSTVTEVEKLTKLEGPMLRTFGSGGFFGYYGKFYNANIGKLTLYATRTDNRILLKTSDKRNIVISPDDMSLFDKLSSAIHKS